MTTCSRCSLKRGRIDDETKEITPQCDRCYDLTAEQVEAVLGLLKHFPVIDWDDGTVTMDISTFSKIALRR